MPLTLLRAFQALSNAPTVDVVDEVMPILKQYVTIMYDRTSTCMKVNDAQRDLFTRKGRDIGAIPPTSDALRQHAKRSTYQAGHCWGNWVKVANDMWAPLWMAIPQASQTNASKPNYRVQHCAIALGCATENEQQNAGCKWTNLRIACIINNIPMNLCLACFLLSWFDVFRA